MFEEYIAKFTGFIGGNAEYIYLSFALIPVLLIMAYFLYYMSFNRILVIKERVGQAFDFEMGSRLVNEKQKVSDLKATMDRMSLSPQDRQKVRAIPTMTRVHRCKVVQRKGSYNINIFHFLSPSTKLKLFGNRFWNISGSKKRLEVLQLSPHIYAPLVTAYDKEAYNKAVNDEAYIDWVVHDIEEDRQKYQSLTFWDKYGGAIMIMITFLLCIIFVVVVFRNLKAFADAGSSGAKALADACTKEFIQRT